MRGFLEENGATAFWTVRGFLDKNQHPKRKRRARGGLGVS
jgi:hypothetical protein